MAGTGGEGEGSAGPGGGGTIAERIERQGEEGQARFDDFSDLSDGGMLWKASLVLLHYIEKKERKNIEGKRVLEMGSGSGHLGIGLAKLGAHVTCTEQRRDGQLDRLEERVRDASAQLGEGGGSVRAAECEWGEEGWARCPLAAEEGGWDVVILSEVVYEEDAHDALVFTLQKVAREGTLLYSIFCDRPWSFMFFVKLHDAGGFEVSPVPDEDVDLLGMQPDAKVCVHKIVAKAAG